MKNGTAINVACGADDRRGWTVVDRIRGLGATFPVDLWLLRWA